MILGGWRRDGKRAVRGILRAEGWERNEDLRWINSLRLSARLIFRCCRVATWNCYWESVSIACCKGEFGEGCFE